MMKERGNANGSNWLLKLPSDSHYDYLPLLGKNHPLHLGVDDASSLAEAWTSSEEFDDEYECTPEEPHRHDLRRKKGPSTWSTALFYFKVIIATLLVTFCGALPFHLYFKAFSTLYLFLVFSFLPLPAAVRYLWVKRPSLRLGPLRSQPASVRKRQAHVFGSSVASLLALCALAFTLWSAAVWYCFFHEVLQRLLWMDPMEVGGASFLHEAWKGADDGGTVFIAVNLYDSAKIVPSFAASLLMLCSFLGHSNVYVSIYESNSSDDTCLLLRDLSRQLDVIRVANTIRCGDHDERYPMGAARRRLRIPFLAATRNEAMKPLYSHADGNASAMGLAPGRRVSKVLWINDVYWEARDALKLLGTNGGDFDQVCAIDTFALGFYDTWVTRDIVGDRLKPLWPYFQRAEDAELVRQRKPVLVNSCWNGITAFDGNWFMASGKQRLHLTQTGEARASLWNVSMPIKFRAVPDEQCVSSECLLSSFDQHLLSHPLRPTIFVNPEIIVSYDGAIHRWWRDWSHWYPVRAWSYLWQDLVAARLFKSVTDWGLKEADCAEELAKGWANPDAPLRRAVQHYQ